MNDRDPDADQRSLLVLDFTGRRAEAPISSLDLESAGFTVQYLIQPPYPRACTARDYAAELLKRRDPSVPRPAGVLAYCMAAPIAQEVLAMEAAEPGPGIPLILFDGEPVTVEAITSEYVLAAHKLGELLGLTAAASTPEVPVDPVRLRASPEHALEDLREGLVAIGRKGGGDEALADAELIADFYLDWLAHLTAGYNADWPALPGRTVHLMSHGHTLPEPWPGGPVSATQRFASDRDGLLLDPGVRAAVLSELRRGN
uniref:Uncharacterized protein n=1 Tax=uncultured bacterium AB_9 TaxID=1630012 RepID=A0A0E3GLU7_9BACT|nr:hypothetical protein [uncultured bacterium AB_9]